MHVAWGFKMSAIGLFMPICSVLLWVLTSPFVQAESWSPPDRLDALPAVAALPDLFEFADGHRVETKADWERRRQELKDILLYYQYGRIPGRPDQVVVSDVRRQPHESGLGTMEFLTLEIDSVRRLQFRAVFYLPHKEGKRPVIIREEDRIGVRKDVAMFLEKGYIFIEYARHDLDPDRDRVVGTAQAAYPSHDWATLAVWAWCGMRLIDYLETRPDVDLTRIGLTGHSRGGKMALLTAALDERISLVVPHQSGSGGAGCYRVLGPGAETLAQNDKPHWYHERIRWFREQEERLPFDQHFLKALVAPRAMLCTESIDDEFANPLGSLVTSAAAQEVYELLDAPEKNAIHFRRGGHATETEDWARILEFAEWQFFDREPKDRSRFWRAPCPLPTGYDSWNIGRKMVASANSNDAGDRLAELPPRALEFKMVGQAGNAADLEIHGQGRYGAVEESFQIAARKVTNADYARFLNAVASQNDLHQVYHPAMSAAIARVSSANGTTFRVQESFAGSPVTNVSWRDAIRYCNWLHNGRPNAPQSAATTERGAYRIDDGTVGARTEGARYFLPTEDEWYKAAYFGQDGVFGHFAPGESNRPILVKPRPDQVSPWGMHDFADSIWEWTESPVGNLHRAVRSGAWFQGNNKQSAGHFYCNPTIHYFRLGFRVARPTRSRLFD